MERYAVVMAGGKGERFWPLSTERQPKQMLSLFGKSPLVTLSVERLQGLVPAENTIVITSRELAPATRKLLPMLPRENVVGEPFGRDTAAAVALGLAVVRRRDPAAVFCVMTADHLIGNVDVFKSTLKNCMDVAAERDVLITMGISPSYAATGFGYIEAGKKVDSNLEAGLFEARRFVEKPDRKTAEQYVASGRYYWNSGMFIWSADSIRSALAKHAPALVRMADRVEPLIGTSRMEKILEAEYSALDRISIDYAVMEKSRNILMARGRFKWDDVGSWASLENHFEKDAWGNIVLGACEGVDHGSNVVVSKDRLTTLVGVKGLIVVQAKGATLICPKDRAQDVKSLVNLLREKGKYGDLL